MDEIYCSPSACSQWLARTEKPRLQFAHKRPAFTITELLCVIGIIAILIGILLPVLSRARASARTVLSSGNLVRLHQAYQSYASSYNGYAPRAYWPGNPAYAPQWVVMIAKQIGLPRPYTWDDIVKVRALHCPTHPAADATTNYVVNAISTKTPWQPAGLTKFDKIRNRGTVPWLLEMPPEFNDYTLGPFDDMYYEQAQHVSEPSHLTGRPSGRGRRTGQNNHGINTSNVLFADGHIEKSDNRKLTINAFDDGVN